jgi:hypothetical protein
MAETGGTVYDDMMNPYPNIAGCVQLVDGNTTCAAPLEQLLICGDEACGSTACTTASDTDYQNCLDEAASGACSAENTAAAPCQADLSDAGALNDQCSTAQGVIYEICGNGM